MQHFYMHQMHCQWNVVPMNWFFRALGVVSQECSSKEPQNYLRFQNFCHDLCQHIVRYFLPFYLTPKNNLFCQNNLTLLQEHVVQFMYQFSFMRHVCNVNKNKLDIHWRCFQLIQKLTMVWNDSLAHHRQFSPQQIFKQKGQVLERSKLLRGTKTMKKGFRDFYKHVFICNFACI